jgi:fimbrial chaperone protein
MHKFNTVIAAVVLALCSAPAFSNVSLGNTRVVVNQTDQSTAFRVNNSGATPLLIQSWISAEDKTSKAPFMVTPPLFRLEAKQENNLRILQLPHQLPKDKESLFWLNVKEIPPLDKNLEGKNVLRIAINNRIKLFYRPGGLPGSADTASQGLQWQLRDLGQGKWKLIAQNPSPYHVTFASVKFNGVVLEANDMLKPGGELSFPLKSYQNKGAQVEYSTITDFGGNSPVISKTAELTELKEIK